MPRRIFLIDDHQLIRDGIRLLLHGHSKYTLVGSAYDTESGWREIQELEPHLVLMDLDVPGEGGVALTARIRAQYPEMKVLVITAHSAVGFVQAALDAGAHGCVLKGNGFNVLLDAIGTVLSGGIYLCPEASSIVVRQMQVQARHGRPGSTGLSERETQVLSQIADGFSTKEIAANLGVSVKTVETHRTNLMSKLSVQSVAELTKYAVREGLSSL